MWLHFRGINRQRQRRVNTKHELWFFSSNGTQLAEFELKESECESIRLQLPAGPSEFVRFSFSDHALDVEGRIAFLVQETDLFREKDLNSIA